MGAVPLGSVRWGWRVTVVDYYAVLDLKPGATIVQVKARFRHLVMAVHPDRNSNDLECQERLKNINVAYEFLSDAAQKADYDACRSAYADAGCRPTVATPRPPVGILRASRTARFLTLVALCAFLTGMIMVAVLLVGSTQPAGRPFPAPAVSVIELPSTADAAASASGEGGMAIDAPSPVAGPGTGLLESPTPGRTLWPGDPSGVPSAPPDANSAAPAPGLDLPVAGTAPPPDSPVTY